jgi:hypothetical protein
MTRAEAKEYHRKHDKSGKPRKDASPEAQERRDRLRGRGAGPAAAEEAQIKGGEMEKLIANDMTGKAHILTGVSWGTLGPHAAV